VSERERGFQTRAIHGAPVPEVDQQTPSFPLYQTSTFRFDDADAYAETIAFRAPGYTYTRGYGNPTLDAFEGLVATLERTEAAMSFASGMAAIHTVWTSHVQTGDRIVATNALYGGAFALATRILPRFGVTVELYDGRDLDAIDAALAGTASVRRSTTRSPRRRSAIRPGTASTSSCTPPRSTSAVTMITRVGLPRRRARGARRCATP
jgi:O-acetylhomoserine/O-acetylserine sulfhydrylase-like pyridoxal-dependent enzyme